MPDFPDEKPEGDETGIDYDALVDKVFHLREIIRSLETEAEEKTLTMERKNCELEELRTALMESLMKQECVQKELQNLKNSSTDKEMIDHIQGNNDNVL